MSKMSNHDPKLPFPSFWLYCHLVSVPSPDTEEESLSVPLPPPAVTVGTVGLPGNVTIFCEETISSSSPQPSAL